MQYKDIAIIKCKGHSTDTGDVSKGNAAADVAAKAVARSDSLNIMYTKSMATNQQTLLSLDDLSQMQQAADKEEVLKWETRGCRYRIMGVPGRQTCRPTTYIAIACPIKMDMCAKGAW